jgi:RNA polymerase sigma factor (TIGR02999 family)
VLQRTKPSWASYRTMPVVSASTACGSSWSSASAASGAARLSPCEHRRVGEITGHLQRAAAGDDAAREQVYTLLYGELKRLARGHLSRAGAITLDPSALVHEAWLRSHDTQSGVSRGAFFAHASAVMRSVIVDHVRARGAEKRGGGEAEVTLSTQALDGLPPAPGVLQVDDALRALARIDERCHRVVEMRYFGGLTLEEIAEATELSVPTLKRDWRRARAFLYDYLAG